MNIYEKEEMWKTYITEIDALNELIDVDLPILLEAKKDHAQDIFYLNSVKEHLKGVRASAACAYSSAKTARWRYENNMDVAEKFFDAWRNGLCPFEIEEWGRGHEDEIAEWFFDTGDRRHDTLHAAIDWYYDGHLFDDDYQREGYPDDEPFRAWKVV